MLHATNRFITETADVMILPAESAGRSVNGETRGYALRRIFCIWNRGYKAHNVAAESIDDALQIVFEAGATRHPTHYRKWRDMTDEYLETPPENVSRECIQRIVEGDTSGILTVSADGHIMIGGSVAKVS